MSVNCQIFLPMDIDESALADAVGIFAGLPKKVVDDGGHVSCAVDGAQTKPTNSPTMGMIVLSAAPGTRLVDGEMSHETYFHWASRFRKKLWILVSPKSTPFWIAIGKRLVNWFGGYLVYNESDEEKGSNIYEGKRSHPVDRDGFYPNDGESRRKYEESVSKLEPVSDADLKAAWKKAAYRSEFAESGKVAV